MERNTALKQGCLTASLQRNQLCRGRICGVGFPFLQEVTRPLQQTGPVTYGLLRTALWFWKVLTITC